MSPIGPYVRLTIDQLATLIKTLTQGGADLSYNDLPPGIYDAQQSEISVGITTAVILSQNPARVGLVWGRSASGTVKVGLASTFSNATGFNVDSTPAIPAMIGREWYELVRRDWFGVSGGPTTVTCIQLLRVADLGGD